MGKQEAGRPAKFDKSSHQGAACGARHSFQHYRDVRTSVTVKQILESLCLVESLFWDIIAPAREGGRKFLRDFKRLGAGQ